MQVLHYHLIYKHLILLILKISAGLTLNAKPISLTLDATGYVKIAATLKNSILFIDQTEEISNKSFNENKKIWSK